ncbi:MAG: amidohydrolase family protein [Clostridia bacterium]|nr:amidohydrolase family protein [Clostridia bacterium]
MSSPRISALKGTLVFTPSFHEFVFLEDHYLVYRDHRIIGAYAELPSEYADIPVEDWTGHIIIPGMCDMHIHAPQYAFRGLGQNIEGGRWDTWFERYAFPDESRYADEEYAYRAYGRLVQDLITSPTTRFCMYSSLHRRGTEILMELLHKAGFAGYVGKVNMDRNSAPGLEETTQESIAETDLWLEHCADGRFGDVQPMLTPRYTPSCTDELMAALGRIAKERGLPVQTHLSEGLDEIEWVKQLKPDIDFYAQAYDMYDLFGTVTPTVLAHCIFPTEEEFDLMRKRNVWVAHCPNGNLNSCGTAAPILDYVNAGIHVGIGTDSAGGVTLNMLRMTYEAMMTSKVRWAYVERKTPFDQKNVLTLANAFYLATKGGGSLWGNVGSFEEGYCLDAVVLDDSRIKDFIPRSTYERVERLISIGDDREIAAKYINGKLVYRKSNGG